MSVSSEGQGGSKDTLLWGLVFIILAAAVVGNYLPVSYTHLDVYKRQALAR